MSVAIPECLTNATTLEAANMLVAGKVTPAEMVAWTESRQRKPATLGSVTAKVGEKGGCVIRGFGRFPLNLYPEGLYRLVAHFAQLDEFVQKHLDTPMEGVAKRKDTAGKTVEHPYCRTLACKDRDTLNVHREAALDAVIALAERVVDNRAAPAETPEPVAA